ncbi:MAG: hypothetical protein D6719_08945 [Candidatus Dadabacteria bacterium]|nr:MAG: hypothetical protein D6719_08945 [Candidatus Dadabacteria bacterium]
MADQTGPVLTDKTDAEKPEQSGPFIPKSPQELARQDRLAGIQHRSHHSWAKTQGAPDAFKGLTAEECTELIKRERKAYRKSGRKSETLEQYEAYVEALRSLRKEQREQNQAATVESLRALEFHGPAHIRILATLQENSGHTLDRLLTDEQLQEAGESPEAFTGILKEGLSRSPEKIIRILGVVDYYLSREEIQAYLKRLEDEKPFALLLNFEQIAAYYDESELPSLVEKLCTNCYSGGFESLHKEVFRRLLEPQRLRELVIAAASRDQGIFSAGEHFNKYLEHGILNKNDIRKIVLHLVRSGNSPELYMLKKVSQYFETDEQRRQLQEAVRAAISRKEKSGLLTILRLTQGVLDTEERRKILNSVLRENPGELWANFDLAEELLEPEQLRSYLVEALNHPKTWGRTFSRALKRILDGELITPEQQRNFLELLCQNHPGLPLGNLEGFLKALQPPDTRAFVTDLLERSSRARVYRTSNNWLPYISESPAEQKAFLRELMEDDSDLSFVETYCDQFSGKKLQELFSRDEILELMYQQLELNPGAVFRHIASVQRILQSDKKLRILVDRAAEHDASGFAIHIEELNYLYSNEELNALFDRLSRQHQTISHVIDDLTRWQKYVGAERVWNFVQENAATHATSFMLSLHSLKRCLTGEQLNRVVPLMLEGNPPIALALLDDLQELRPGLTSDELIAFVESDADNSIFAPKTLRELSKWLKKKKGQKLDHDPRLLEAAELYMSIATIKNAGLEAALNKIQSVHKLSRREEKQLISVFECFAELKNDDPESWQRDSYGSTLEESKEILLSAIGKRLGTQGRLTTEEIERFIDTMGSPAPFLIYYLRHKDSPEHRELLKGLFESIIEDRFEEWKYGNNTSEAFEALKAAKLIPESLRLEQYRIWQQEDVTTLQETLSSDAEQVAQEIKKLILQNLEHLGPKFADKDEDLPKSLSELKESRRILGEEIGRISKEISKLKQAESDKQAEYQALQEKRQRLLQQKEKLDFQQVVFQLLELSADEISLGYLLHNDDTTKKTIELKQVLDSFEEMLPSESKFLAQRIRTLLSEFYSQTSEPEELSCSDEDGPGVTIEIGAVPVGSCQHYSHGSYNSALLGYFEPNTKILVLRNAQGTPVARAIFRLLTTDQGEPALQLERIYSSTGSSAVQRIMVTHAQKKAEAMGVELFSHEPDITAEQAGGKSIENAPEGYAWTPTKRILFSERSRAPVVYVDAADGSANRGRYRISGLQKLVRTAG